MSDERRNQKLNRQDAKAAKKGKTIFEPQSAQRGARQYIQ
jgi:hypothetical protein